MEMNNILDKVWELMTIYGLRVIAAVLILLVGRWVAMAIRNLVRALLRKAAIDKTISSFVANLTYTALLAFIVLAALNQLGIQTTSFIAVLGAAGLAVGLALQGSLANFAAGFLMILFKPFSVGDYIEGGGVTGTVEEIQIFTTTLVTPDNKTIIVPNAKMTNDNIVNWTIKGTRRVDLTFCIGYGDDLDKAMAIIGDILAGQSKVLKDPPAQVALVELAESSVKVAVRPWAKVSDYWDVYLETLQRVKKAFEVNGISWPIPRREIHLYPSGSRVQRDG